MLAEGREQQAESVVQEAGCERVCAFSISSSAAGKGRCRGKQYMGRSEKRMGALEMEMEMGFFCLLKSLAGQAKVVQSFETAVENKRGGGGKRGSGVPPVSEAKGREARSLIYSAGQAPMGVRLRRFQHHCPGTSGWIGPIGPSAHRRPHVSLWTTMFSSATSGSGKRPRWTAQARSRRSCSPLDS